jgi:hypothetical protein
LYPETYFPLKISIRSYGSEDNQQQFNVVQKLMVQSTARRQTTLNIHWESMLEAAFDGPLRHMGGPQVQIICSVNSTPLDRVLSLKNV